MWAWGTEPFLELLIHPEVSGLARLLWWRETVRPAGDMSFWSSLALAPRTKSLGLSSWIPPTHPCLFLSQDRSLVRPPGKEAWWGSHLGRLSNVLVVTKNL